ncbi:hypothetical protein [Fulvimarina sp. MAC3]|uniref:hypothetical protein n=1 Tax=Fulvimarina sp. MAC3 TaxID=3148887 RepID=UPI0031FC49CD
MLLTRAHALTTVALLSTSLAIASPVGTAQGGLTSIASERPGAAGMELSLSSSNGIELQASKESLATLTKYFPDLTRSGQGQPDEVAAAANPFSQTSSTANSEPPASLPAENPFAMPADENSGSEASSEGETAPFAINGEKDSSEEQSGGIDERALRYYADQRNLERVGAEIRRLKALNPSWTPPTDLFTAKSNVNEQPAWDLFADGQFEAARQKIEEWKKTDANYQPSTDLLTKLDDGDARAKIKQASEQKDWSGALKVARERPTLLVCEEMDALWRVGEAFARTKDYANAFDLYSYILKNCSNENERIATLQKAASLLPQKGTDALVASLDGDLADEISGYRFADIRASIAKSMTSTIGRKRIAGDDLSQFEAYVRENKAADDAKLLGWFAFNAGDYETANTWFDLALDGEDDSEALKGYVLSLRNMEKTDEAEDIAFENIDRSPDLAKIYVELVAERMNGLDEDETLSRSELERIQTAIEDSKSAVGAQTLGWYLLDRKEAEKAEDWFVRSVEWEPSEEGVIGLAVVASRAKDGASLKAIKAEYGERYAALSEFEEYRPPARVISQAAAKPSRHSAKSTRSKKRVAKRSNSGGDRLMRQANRQFEAGQYQAALQTLDQREARNGKSYGAEVLRGWTNYKLNRWNEAERVFRAQDRVRSTKATRSGIGAVQNTKYGMWPETTNRCTERWRC